MVETPSIEHLLQEGCLPTKLHFSPDQFDELWELCPKSKDRLWGVDLPRFQQSYLKNYKFSGSIHQAKELPTVLQAIFDWAKSEFNQDFNQVFVNWYPDGNSYMGKHADDETQFKKGSHILSVSLGETRTFRIHPKYGGRKVLDIQVKNNTYILMKYPMQQHYKHSIVKINGDKGKQIGRRINITFRVFQD